MDPEIRYTTTADGASIAYYAMGEGPALVVTSHVLWSHFNLQPFREFHRSGSGHGLGRGLQVVRYDARGTGMSGRDSLDFSIEARVRDMEAVIGRLSLTKLALFGASHGGLAAIRYAAEQPERVSHLVLFGAYARGSELAYSFRHLESLHESAADRWEQYTLTLANSNTGFSFPEYARKLAALYRESMTPASVRAFVESTRGIDVTELLPRVSAPTLVMTYSDPSDQQGLEWSRELASKIRDARFVTLALTDERRWTDKHTAIVEEFLGLRHESAEAAAGTRSSGTAIILFTDIAGSTALTERMGDAAFREASRTLDDGVRAAMRESGGTPVEGKVLGDGVMGVFASAAQAIAAARACVSAAETAHLQLHIGLHAGDVIREEDNVYGGAVNIASRICGLCEPGEILVSQTVRDLARTSAGVTFEDRGERALKGVGDPVRVFVVSPTAKI
jgi:class 3 adenylate cyclase